MDCLTSKYEYELIDSDSVVYNANLKLHFRGFQAYLAGAPNYNFSMYKQLVHEITMAFKKISDEILSIKTQLADVDAGVAKILDKIQDVEKEKLADVSSTRDENVRTFS